MDSLNLVNGVMPNKLDFVKLNKWDFFLATKYNH